MEVVRPNTEEQSKRSAGKNRRTTARKAVNVLEAILSALRDPSVHETVSRALAHQKKVAAERSFAGQADNVFSIATDPRVLAVAELLTSVAKKQISTRKR